jgi:hypothetical protein
MCIGLHVKYPLFLSVCNETWTFSIDFRTIHRQISYLMNSPVGAEVFHKGRRADERTDMMKLSLLAILRTRLKTIKSSDSTAVCRDSVVGIGWMVWGSSPSGGKRYLLLQKHRAAQRAHSPTYSTGTGVIFGWGWQSDRAVMLTSHLRLVRRLRISGAIPLLSLYAFMACKGTTLCFQSA